MAKMSDKSDSELRNTQAYAEQFQKSLNEDASTPGWDVFKGSETADAHNLAHKDAQDYKNRSSVEDSKAEYRDSKK